LEQASAERQLRQFVARFGPTHQTLIRAVRKALRQRWPTAYELAYDNYNFFVIGYSPTERPSDAIVSLTAGANGVGLCFLHGATLRDPKGILLGSGNQTRFIRLAQSKTSMRMTGRRRLIIRSVSATRRTRRKPST
jgi:hypothetical protein